MKIEKINEYDYRYGGYEAKIIFNNGKEITTHHCQDCCEMVYAKVEDIDDLAYTYEFEEPLIFEAVEEYGFRFGNIGKMVSVPCYDEQNGYYNGILDVYYDGEHVLEASPKRDYS